MLGPFYFDLHLHLLMRAGNETGIDPVMVKVTHNP